MTTTATLTIAEFLLARIAEDERWAAERWAGATLVFDDSLAVPGSLARVLAECEAHRRIVALHGEVTGSTYYYGDDTDTTHGTPACEACGRWDEYAVRYPCPTLRALAAVYSDHPDYRPDWRP